ncbi:MAG TPA: hypothetical protein VGC42_27960, partial [Kofleriaceae bacterium]
MRRATQALTVLAELDPARRATLEQRLAEIAASPDDNPWFAPGELPDTHFTRFVIVDDPRGELPALLAWEANHDGAADAYLEAIARGAPRIEQLLACCRGYPPSGIADLEAWLAWIRPRRHRAAAFYTGYRGVARSTVVNDREVHDELRHVLDAEDRRALRFLSRHELQRRLCAAVRHRRPMLDLSPADDLAWLRLLGLRIATVIAWLPLILLAIALALPWYLVLRHRESTDLASAYARPVGVPAAVGALEDVGRQNPLTHLVDIKPGWFRLTTLRLVLALIDALARIYAVHGDLGGITAIHFARWVILYDRRPGRRDRRHRLLFLSNYDGSWESYLGEFVDRAAPWLTAVWSNTRGF